jgi:hypothetical protein
MQLRLGRQSDKGLQLFTLPSLFGVIRDRIHGFVCHGIGTNRMPYYVDEDPELAEVIAPHHCHIGQRPCSSRCEFPDTVFNAVGCPRSSVLARRPTNCGCRYLRQLRMINKDPNALEANHNIASLQQRHTEAGLVIAIVCRCPFRSGSSRLMRVHRPHRRKNERLVSLRCGLSS